MQALRYVGITLTLVWIVACQSFAAPITVTGTVVEAGGKPLGGAQVIALAYGAHSSINRLELRTDDNGGFAFQTEPPWGTQVHWECGVPVLARHPGLAMALGVAKPTIPLVLKLGDKPETRSGMVLDPEGEPVANLKVSGFCVYRVDGSSQTSTILSARDSTTTTDAQGRFSFGGFGPDLSVNVDLVSDGSAAISVPIHNSTPVTISLPPEATVSGTVLINGKPQAGIRVWAAQSGRSSNSNDDTSADTAADGRYTLHHLDAGTAQVMVVAPYRVRAEPRPVTLQHGQARTGVDFNLTPGAVIRGRVTDEETGKAVARALVQATAGGGPDPTVVSATADADGKWELRVAAGTYFLRCVGLGDTMMWFYPPSPPPPPGGVTPVGPIAPAAVTVNEGDVTEGHDLTIRLPR